MHKYVIVYGFLLNEGDNKCIIYYKIKMVKYVELTFTMYGLL